MRREALPLSFRCDQRWEDMPGDERTRRCDRCDRRVHDLSAGSELRARVWLATKREPCVRYAVRPDGSVRFRASRLARVAAVALALLPAVARAEPAAEKEDVHLCSPPVADVHYVGGIRRGPRLLPDFAAIARAFRPQGEATAHLVFDPDRWNRVAVRCRGVLLARRADASGGEVTVEGLPDERACTATLKGDARPTRVEFVAGDTRTELKGE